MLNWLKWRIARKELEELARWRSVHDEYSRWLAEFPQIALTLQGMRCVVRGDALDACYPPSTVGPWIVDGLRYRLRMLTPNAGIERQPQP